MSKQDFSEDSVKNALSSFLERNTGATISAISDPEKCIAVKSPWGDDSLILRIDENDKDIIDSLNNVILPERFSAIWHSDTNKLEIIFTALALPKRMKGIQERKFEINFEGKIYFCNFEKSSERLLSISNSFRPLGPSSTSYRNLFSYHTYLRSNGKENFPKDATPISFWISGIEWDDDLVLRLMMHINFYMSYYDSFSPIILVHSPKSENVVNQPQTRFTEDKFPSEINALPIDDHLLHFWDASRSGDPIRRFLYCYQILEYSAFYVLEDTIKSAIRKLLIAPHARSNIERVAAGVIEAMSESKMSDPQKIESLFRQCVDYNKIWTEIHNNADFFTKTLEFDGGFVIKPIIKSGWTAADFSVHWLPAFPNALRTIRNALSHGREMRQTAVITPTTANFARLQSWVSPIAAAAKEVMIYRGI